LLPKFESFHDVLYDKESINAAVELSDKYINDRNFPDKAIDVIDEAGANIKLRSNKKTKNKISKVDIEDVVARMTQTQS
jgi:ATP-dependent Clp protease ATP-binding subunit ClpA